MPPNLEPAPSLSSTPFSGKIANHGHENTLPWAREAMFSHPHPMAVVNQCLPTEIFPGTTFLFETLAQDNVLVSFWDRFINRSRNCWGFFANSMFRKCSAKDLEYLKCFALSFLLPQPQIYVVTHHSQKPRTLEIQIFPLKIHIVVQSKFK